MALYRSIQMSFWTDVKVVDEFTPEDKFFYIYLMTNPHTNLAGCYELSLKQASVETGYTVEAVKALINRFESYHKVIRFDPDTREVLILNWSKYNWTSSEKLRVPLAGEIGKIKNPQFRNWLESIFDGEVEIEEPEEEAPKPEKKRFTPPTVQEVKAYCIERGNNVDPQTFVDFYESKGWMVGKSKMKDWKASVRTWEKGSRANSSTAKYDEVDRWAQRMNSGRS